MEYSKHERSTNKIKVVYKELQIILNQIGVYVNISMFESKTERKILKHEKMFFLKIIIKNLLWIETMR